MCPSISCPNCGRLTYHRGTCENKACGYDPMSASLSLAHLPQETQTQFLQRFPEIIYSVGMTPFPRVRFSSDSMASITHLINYLRYDGPTFSRSELDPLDTEGHFGFELVKDKAQKFFDHLRPIGI